MSAAEAFFDTSVLLYLFSADAEKANRAEKALAKGGVISLQVLNELTSVGRRKLQMSWEELRDALDSIRRLCRLEPLTEQTHDIAFELAIRYELSWYDALIVAAALLADCRVVYSEDMHSGLRIKQRLKIVNPFE